MPTEIGFLGGTARMAKIRPRQAHGPLLDSALVVVPVLNTDNVPREGLPVYVFDGTAYTGYHGVTDAAGHAVFTLPQGDYRFRSDLNGTQFWSGETDDCGIPGCFEASVTVTIPLTVIVQSETGSPYPDLPVYAFDGDSYTGYHGTSDENGQVVLTLPAGDYRFRADYDGVQFWSGLANHCTIPGCLEALVEIPGGVGGPVSVTIDYSYDPLQRLVAADYSTGEFFHYSYDAVGNRLTQEALAGTNVYTYDIANRLVEVDGVTYTWDDNGNLLEDGLREYAYDHANRLISVEMGADSYEFGYSGLGDRLRQTVNGAAIDYTLDLAAGLTQVLSEGDNAYLYGVGRIGEQQPDGWQYHLGDALGSVRLLANSTGTPILSRSFEPFGSVLSTFGSPSTEFSFVGERLDRTGLTYLRARYLESAQGRFLSRDTWDGDPSKPLSFNRWIYVQANATNKTDPSGLCEESGWNDAQGLFTEANCDALEADLRNGTTDFTEAWYRQLAARERSDGYEQAARNLEHYLDGGGGEYAQQPVFVQDTITYAMPEIGRHIDDLANWYVKKHFSTLTICEPTAVGPDTYAWLINAPNYIAIGLGLLPRQEAVAAAVGTFRIDVELSGILHRKTSFLWFSNVDADLDVHATMLDVYNWNPGDWVIYPPRVGGNKILDDWAFNLESHGRARRFVVRGDYAYSSTLEDIGGPGLFFDANSPPGDWVFTSCVGSQFDIDAEGAGTIDYCGNPIH